MACNPIPNSYPSLVLHLTEAEGGAVSVGASVPVVINTAILIGEDRAEQLKREPDKVVQELDRCLRADLRKAGDFKRIHPMPGSSADALR